MTVEQFVAVLGALTVLVGAVGALVLNVLKLRRDIDGRLSELLVATSAAASKQGELVGRDFRPQIGQATETPNVPTS